MAADDRVIGLGIGEVLAAGPVGIGEAKNARAVVMGGHALEIGLHLVGQAVIGGIGAGEHRVAAILRQDLHVQDAAHWRHGIAGEVGMPALARHYLGGLVGMDARHLGIVARQ